MRRLEIGLDLLIARRAIDGLVRSVEVLLPFGLLDDHIALVAQAVHAIARCLVDHGCCSWHRLLAMHRIRDSEPEFRTKRERDR